MVPRSSLLSLVQFAASWLALVALAPNCLAQAADALGVFEHATDIGKITLAGHSEFLADKAQYRISGSGANMWASEDAFHFLWKQLSGDIAFTMNATWPGDSKEPHRKASAIIRQGLAADDPYVDIAIHGDGLIALQYRKEKGGATFGIRTPIKAPATVKLERDGDVFTASVAKSGVFQPIGAVSLALRDPVYVGLGVTAHNANQRETALISNVSLTNRRPLEREQRVRETSLETLVVATGQRRLVYRDRTTFEAPNWSRDGQQFFINRGGGIYTIPVGGGEPQRLATGAAERCNNDHGLSFDGQWLAISSGGGSEQGSRIYIVPARGGESRLVTPTGPSYWHGWSPDGKTLAFCGRRNGNFDIYTVPAAGGAEQRLTTAEGLDDGCDYTADGTKIYFNSERTGVMQIWRMNPDGSAQERVTNDPEFADWFPHPSPDGKWLVFLSFDKSVKGHPANQNVTLRLMPLAGGKQQVTINVPSWSPDSQQIAFVSYRHVLP